MRRGIAGLSLSAYSLLYGSTLCLYYQGQLLVLEATAQAWMNLLFATFYISAPHLARLQTDAIILLIATADCWGERKKVSWNNTSSVFLLYKKKLSQGLSWSGYGVVHGVSHNSDQMSQK